jgi:hypothetical protein
MDKTAFGPLAGSRISPDRLNVQLSPLDIDRVGVIPRTVDGPLKPMTL